MSKHKCEVAFLACDTCGAKAEVNVTTEETELPAGWLHVEIRVDHRYNSSCTKGGSNVFEFCGKACCKKKLMQTIGGDK